MDEQKINEFIQIVIDQIKSDKDNLDIAIDIAGDLANKNSIPAEILLDFVHHFVYDNFHDAAYVLSKVATSLSIGETQANAHYNAGLASMFLGRMDEAEEQYKAALAADPNDVNTHYNYGILLQDSGRIDEAEEQYKAALAADPNDVNTHYNYGNLLSESGRIDEAEEQYKAALAVDPNHVNTHSIYGVLLSESGRIDEAEEQYKAALAADPEYANAHGAYGLLLFKRNENKKALNEIKIASQLFGKEDDKVMEHIALAWLYELYTDKFYKKAPFAGCPKTKYVCTNQTMSILYRTITLNNNQ